MKMLMVQPPHAFVETELPPMPGAGHNYRVVRCLYCNLMGYTSDNECLHVMGAREEDRAGACTGHDGPQWYARILNPTLAHSAPGYAHLKLGTVHRLILPRKTALGSFANLPSVWVHGTPYSVRIKTNDFTPLQVRTRRRPQHMAPAPTNDTNTARAR